MSRLSKYHPSVYFDKMNKYNKRTNVSIKFNSIEEYREIENKLIELGYKEHSKTLDDFMLEDLPNNLFATVFYKELKYCVFDFTQKDELVYNSLEEFLKDD